MHSDLGHTAPEWIVGLGPVSVLSTAPLQSHCCSEAAPSAHPLHCDFEQEREDSREVTTFNVCLFLRRSDCRQSLPIKSKLVFALDFVRNSPQPPAKDLSPRNSFQPSTKDPWTRALNLISERLKANPDTDDSGSEIELKQWDLLPRCLGWKSAQQMFLLHNYYYSTKNRYFQRYLIPEFLRSKLTSRTSWKCEGGVSLSLDNRGAEKGFSLVYGGDAILSLIGVQPLTNVHLYFEGNLCSSCQEKQWTSTQKQLVRSETYVTYQWRQTLHYRVASQHNTLVIM